MIIETPTKSGIMQRMFDDGWQAIEIEHWVIDKAILYDQGLLINH